MSENDPSITFIIRLIQEKLAKKCEDNGNSSVAALLRSDLGLAMLKILAANSGKLSEEFTNELLASGANDLIGLVQIGEEKV